MSARDEAIEMIRRICPPHLDADEYRLILGEKFDAYRAEVLAEAKVETVAWLVKKAAEGRNVGDLASKVDRGAVRAFLGTAHYRDALDAHRSQVLAEAAALLTARGYAIPADLVLQLAKRDPSSPAEAEATPDNDAVARRAHLARAIRQGGRWKSGTVVRWYEEQGYEGLGPNAARNDLAALRRAGLIVQHDEKGVRWYSLARQGGAR
jgi:DNA-binding transcriptional ArsR family regulator